MTLVVFKFMPEVILVTFDVEISVSCGSMTERSVNTAGKYTAVKSTIERYRRSNHHDILFLPLVFLGPYKNKKIILNEFLFL